MFEQTFKNIDDILHKDAGCGSELDYVEQTSWVLFLKYLDDLEKDKQTAAELTGKTYTFILSEEYKWNNWAMPKTTGGKIDHHKALTGDDLSDFVNNQLFPYLKKFKADAESADTIEYKIGEIFSELKNRIQSGYNLREVINLIDELRFRTHKEKHEMSHLYESKIKNMGNAGRNGGEYYTPRPLIKTIIKVVNPKIGNTIYDGAVGSAGFLVEAFQYLKNVETHGRAYQKQTYPVETHSCASLQSGPSSQTPKLGVSTNNSNPSVQTHGRASLQSGQSSQTQNNASLPKTLSTDDIVTLQKKTFYGKEKKSLAYIIGIMNMILHGIEAPNIIHTNTLAENLADIQQKDRYDVVLANPPFGGKERAEVQQNFPIKTGETASLFLQHFIKILKAGGKAGVVIKNTFLSNTDNASVSLRKELLSSCNLHTVLDLPGGTFTGAGVKTVVLFFEKGTPTKKTWFYQLNLDRNLGKTNPLNEKDLEEFVTLSKTKAESENSWTVNIKDIDQTTLDLSAKNPNTPEEAPLRQPNEILKEMAELDKEREEILKTISELL
jgi:type I restriction enzyme M protein